ncbi:MAG: YbaN family protein [Planctomycetes bacterium]|nr:YbaN family protein [Planctomycetota bacterium]
MQAMNGEQYPEATPSWQSGGMTEPPGTGVDDAHPRRDWRRAALAAAGYGFFALGAVGVVVPGLPTVVFWIVAAWLWARSHPERFERLIAHPRYGAVIGDFLHHGVMSRRSKRAAVIGIAFGYALFLLGVRPSLVGALGMGALLACVALWLLRRPEHSPLLPPG